MESDEYLLISGIQHFTFCRRQWALIHIEDCWDENQLTAEGRILHKRVHSEGLVTKRNGIITLRDLPVRSDKLKISGKCDAVELLPVEHGVSVFGREGSWQIHPVEYKHGKSKANDCDRLQLVAESICLEEMLSCHIESGSIYYAETRHREEVLFDDELRKKLNTVVAEMRSYYERHYTPKVKVSKLCKSCSLANNCLPELLKDNRGHKSVKEYVEDHVRESAL